MEYLRMPTPELAWPLRHSNTPNTRNQSLLCYTVPQALHSLPVLFRGDGEEGQPSSSVCVVSSHQVYQANQAPIPAPNTVWRPTIARMQLLNNYSSAGKTTPKQIIQSQMYKWTWGKHQSRNVISEHSSQHGEKWLQMVCAWGRLVPDPQT